MAGEVGTVANPHRQRLAADLFADLDALDVVRHGLGAHAGIGMGQAAELVRQRLVLLVGKGVGVDRVKPQAEGLGVLAQFFVVVDLVPRKVRRHGGRAAHQLVDHAAVLQLVEHIARLALAGEAGEARAAGAHAPAGHGHGELGYVGFQHIDIHTPAG